MTVAYVQHHITIAGRTREFWAYLPDGFKKAMLGLHGAHGTGEGFGYKRHFVAQAEQGMASVFPTSLRWEGRRAWATQGEQYEEERLFLLALKQWLLGKGATGVGIGGNSSGGYMTWKMAFEDPRREDGTFAFYVPSNANWPHGWAAHQQPVPVFIPHGTNDRKIPFEGTEDQWGWRDAMWRMARINNGGEPANPEEATSKTVRSCFGKTTTLVTPATQVAVAGARVNGGYHAWHACGKWQVQQMVLKWADRAGLWG